MICAKALAVGPGKGYSECIGQADLENDSRCLERADKVEGHIDRSLEIPFLCEKSSKRCLHIVYVNVTLEKSMVLTFLIGPSLFFFTQALVNSVEICFWH